MTIMGLLRTPGSDANAWSNLRLAGKVLLAYSLVLCTAAGQTTQAWLVGRVLDSISGRPVVGAKVRCQSVDTGISLPAATLGDGRFAFAALSPGRYTVTIEDSQHQTQELRLLELPVAGRLELEFHLRPRNDLW